MQLKLSEKAVTEQCIAWLNLQGFLCVRLNSGLLATPDGRRMRIGEKGLPDWVCLRGGFGSDPSSFFLELKATGKKATPEQLSWAKATAEKYNIPTIFADNVETLQECI